jgi:hypothetical protein
VSDPDPVVRGVHQYVAGDWEPVESEPHEVRTPELEVFDLEMDTSASQKIAAEGGFSWLYPANWRPDHEIDIDELDGKQICHSCRRRICWAWDLREWRHV